MLDGRRVQVNREYSDSSVRRNISAVPRETPTSIGAKHPVVVFFTVLDDTEGTRENKKQRNKKKNSKIKQ